MHLKSYTKNVFVITVTVCCPMLAIIGNILAISWNEIIPLQ